MPSPEAIRNAGAALARVLDERDAMTPRQLAAHLHVDGGPTLLELENRVRAERGLPAVDAAVPAPRRPA